MRAPLGRPALPARPAPPDRKATPAPPDRKATPAPPDPRAPPAPPGRPRPDQRCMGGGGGLPPETPGGGMVARTSNPYRDGRASCDRLAGTTHRLDSEPPDGPQPAQRARRRR